MTALFKITTVKNRRLILRRLVFINQSICIRHESKPRTTSLIGVPFGLAVVTEGVSAAGSFARYPRARRAAGSDHSVSAIWSRAPTSVWIGRKDAAQHEKLVELQQVVVIANQHLDV